MEARCSDPLIGRWADAHLATLGLERNRLLAVADSALAAGRDLSPFALAMAAGMNMYLVGGESLRGEHVGERWLSHRAGNLEGIISVDGQIIVYFQNAHLCCQAHLPEPRSKRGPQSELASAVNLFEAQGIDLPARSKGAGTKCASVYYLLVDEDGRVELSSMVIEGGVFVAYGERAFLRDDLELEPRLVSREEPPAPIIEIAISRK